LGTAAATNVPGAREGSVTWTDLSGNLWLFGGDGYSSSGSGDLNDLWEFNPSTGEWTWMGGSKTINQSGIYGTLGLANTSNIPGARQNAMSWTDIYGNFWLFGGEGYDSTGAQGPLNDLWEFVPSTGDWTWVSGANLINQVAVYGTEGTPALGNVPSSRFYGQAWADASGNLWLFGGEVYCSQCGQGSTNYGNDLWEFTPTNNEWTWVGGTNLVNQTGVYGTQGTASASNIPPATYEAVTWTDAAGAFWMFGGGANILWRYAPGSPGEWTWVDGTPITQCGCSPFYGTVGIPGPNNIPGGRIQSVEWFDRSGNAWIFGGIGEDSQGNVNALNDLWQYGSGEWTWMSGANVAAQKGVYGTLGVEALANTPGARSAAISWIDSSGNLWLFGGAGYDSTGTQGTLNDLWKFTP
jgi:N-acetylneuraminic acid mutarotase